MTEIYLIRHTQAEGNLYKVMQGFWDGDVTALGLREIRELAERFRTVPVDAVYSSDLYRAKLTAQAVTKYSGKEVLTDVRFREINMGPLEGCFMGNVIHSDPENMRKFLTTPWEWSCEGAETLEEVSARAVPAIRELAEKHDGQTIAVVSHGITVRCLLTKLLQLPEDGEGMAPIVGNTAVSKLRYENGTFTADYLNDMSHLGPLERSDWAHGDVLRHERFDPAEAPEVYLAACREGWSAAHGGSLTGFDPDFSLNSATAHYRKDPDAVLRLFFRDRPAGFVDLDTERGAHMGYGWVSLLYLEPEFRSKGLGIQALGRAIMRCRHMGRTALRLNAAAANTAALRFYEKYGFRVLNEEITSSGRVFLLEKSLDRIKEP